MHEIKAYQCDYCKKYGKSKSNIKKHECRCYHNPVTRACATCQNLIQDVYKVDKRHFSEDFQGDVYDAIPKCKYGKNISSVEDSGKVVNLRNNCECWIEKQNAEEE